jgi:hypothetical protein
VRRLIPLVLLALTASSASAAGADDPALVPSGTWFFHSTRATYSGPPIPVRAMLTKIMDNRVTFQPACVAGACTVTVTIYRPPRGTPARFRLKPRSGWYVGSTTLTSSLRCNGRALKARLKMSIRTAQRLDDDVLWGMTEAVAVNPGGCNLFRGKARGIRKQWFNGAR